MGNKKGEGFLVKRGKYWYVRITVDGKPIWKSLKTGDKKQAEKLRKDFIHPFVLGDKIATLNNIKAQLETEKTKAEVKTERIPLEKSLFVYLSDRTDEPLADGTVDNYSSFVKCFTDWFKGNYLCEVTKSDVHAFWDEMKTVLTLERLKAVIFCLRRVWKSCMKRDNNIRENPWYDIDIKGKRCNVKKRRELSTDEIRRLLEAASSERFEKYWNGETFMLFVIGAYTAMRLMDCVNLRWSDVGEDLITVVPQKTRKKGISATIPISDPLRNFLRNWKDSGKSSDEYVLPLLQSLTRRKINKMVHNVFEAAKIKICEKDESGHVHIKTGFHSLRVHGLSEFMRMTGNINVVQHIAGHAHPDMTLWYTHCNRQDIINAFSKNSQGNQNNQNGQTVSISAETARLLEKCMANGESVDDFLKRTLCQQNAIELKTA